MKKSLEGNLIDIIAEYYKDKEANYSAYDIPFIVDIALPKLRIQRVPLRKTTENLFNRLRREKEKEELEDVRLMETKDTNAINSTLHQLYKPAVTHTPSSEKAERKRKRALDVEKVEEPKRIMPTVRLKDIGGIHSCIQAIQELVAMPFLHGEVYRKLGINPPRGVLLHGPPGCGKTMLANAIAAELDIHFMNISAPSLVAGTSGESEKKIRELFAEATLRAPCLVFIDEIDAITPKRETAQREMERRIVAQLLTCMSDLDWSQNDYKPVIVIGATNRPDALDPALRRAGRFDREIAFPVPDEAARISILKVLCEKLSLSGNFDFLELARRTPGYVGADLVALTNESGMIAMKRIFGLIEKTLASDDCCDMEIEGFEFNGQHYPKLTTEQLESVCITNSDFLEAIPKVQPSSKREGFATVPDVTWEEIGALSKVRGDIRMAIVEPVKNPKLFANIGITAPSGILLWGPPGCGKTLLAKAVANESHSNFISVKGPELLNKYVGESERAVRQVFSRANASSPCVIFFDEIDALCPRRDDSKSEASQRVVNTLLTELDGMDCRKQVFVIAATNRPDIIDPAMLRPGRLDKLLYVELPTADERVEILKTIQKSTPLAEDVNLEQIGRDERCDGFSGADLAALMKEAAMVALKQHFINCGEGDSDEKLQVTSQHFELAFENVGPSVGPKEKASYDRLLKRFTNRITP